MLRFDYRTIDTSGLTAGVVETQLKMLGAAGWRLAFCLPTGLFVLELISDPEERSAPSAPAPTSERITPQGEVLDEYTCGCGCGSVVPVPARLRAEIVRDCLVPFLPGHGPRPEERTVYLTKKQ